MDELASEATLDLDAALAGGGADLSSNERFRALYDIGRLLLEQREPDRLPHTIQKALVENTAPDHACILRVLPEGLYEPVCAYNLDLEGPPDRWPISSTALQSSRERRVALLATDVLRDPQFESSGSVQKLRIRSVMCVPLGKSQVRGMIYLDRRSRNHPFNRQDLHFLTAVSAQASLVLERLEDLARAQDALARSDERCEVLQRELLRHRIVGKSPQLLQAYDTLGRLARGGARVLLRGETGTGKELFARAYAANAHRPGKPYVPVAIPSLAPNLIESELFGHVKGAFTEATRDKKGYLEVANGGVLFLDEIGDLDEHLQVKLLRFLDSGEVSRVGATETRFIDALVVSATNRLLERLVEQERFRPDLLARLGHTITIPPLRERPEDIPLLVEHFLQRYCRERRRVAFSPEALELMQQYRWEFNVRQLQQVVEGVVCLLDRDTVRPEDLPEFVCRGAGAGFPSGTSPASGGEPLGGGRPARLREVVERAEKEHILRTLDFTKGNRRRAIELLGLSSETFYKRLKRFGLLEREASK